MPKLYISPSNPFYPPTELPVYTLTDGEFYRTVYHPQGWSDKPDYTLATDGQIYRTPYHPDGTGDSPDYHIQPDLALARSADHPDGKPGIVDFRLEE